MIISKTPFRVSFFGGGTDYPSWYHTHGGAVLSTTINKYTYVTCRWLPPFFPHKHRVVYSRLEDVRSPYEIIHPSINAVLSAYNPEKGIELHTDADLPARSGLGSSSAFLVGLLHSMEALMGKRVTPMWLAKEAIRFEQNVLAEHVGSQDQVAAAFGGLNVIQFERDDEISVRPVIISKARKKLLNNHLMLFFTGFSRSASEVAQVQIKNIDNRTAELRKIYSMVHDALDILSSETDIRHFGEMLHEAWMFKRSLSSRITSDRIDEIYDRARQAGAIGGKLLGAGGGGFFLLFVEPDKQQAVKEALKHYLYVPFEFETGGSQIIYFTE